MKRLIYILLLSFEILLLIFFQKNIIHIPCVFKAIFHIPCPGCGLTRAIGEFVQFRFIKAISYNILIVPIVFFFVVLNVFLILDLINDRNRVFVFVKKISYQWKILIILLILSEFINLYHNI